MASSYMDDFRKQKYSIRDTAIAAEQKKFNDSVSELEKQKKPEAKFMDFYLIPVIVFTLIGAAMFFIISFWGLILGVILGFAFNFLLYFLKRKIIESHNSKINGKIYSEKDICESNCKRISDACTNEIKQEENRYKTNASKARKTYGGSTVIDPMINWLVSAFDNKIKSADRGAYLQQISANIAYRVNEKELVLLEFLPHSNTYSECQKFDYFRNRFTEIPDFFDRVGLAQALSKRVELEILRRYSIDPIAPSKGNKPKIIIEYDDNFIKLIYQVYNPNYRVAVNPKVGLGYN